MTGAWGAGYRRSMQTEGGSAELGLQYWEMVLSVVQGPYQGREFTFTADTVTAGKAPQNDIPLPDETVSRRHLEIVREGRGYLLRDLGSTNGTFLDGSEIREAFLRSGAQVTCGQTRFRFRAVERRVEVTPWEGGPFEGLVGESAAIRRVFGQVRAVAPLDLTVVLEGEEGSGRRSLAAALHRRSALRESPLHLVDCGALPPGRIEAALLQPGVGALDSREGGTVVIVEPWEIPMPLQGQVAEAIRNRQTPPPAAVAGGSVPRGARRIVAVTARPLDEELARGRLDPELHAVLDRVRIAVPSLRSRPEDGAPALATHLEARGAGRGPALHKEVDRLLGLAAGAGWPGNLRGLLQLGDALVGLTPEAEGGVAGEAPLAATFSREDSFGDAKARFVEEFERRYVAWLLAEHEGNVSRAARAADMDRKHLHRLLKRYGHR